ncbi:MAG: GtrA family protein [Acidimicrobiia bacterium]
MGTVPGTGLPWLEVLSKDILLLDRSAPAPIRAALDERWELVGQRRGYDRLERRRPAPGRLTWVPPQVTSVRAEHVGFERERYRLAWQSDAPVRIVTRIPWWPGYQASLDGVPVPVTSVEDTVVAVDLPSGQHRSELEIWFSHPRASAAKGAVALGGLAAVAAGLIEAGAFRRLRRSRRHIRAPRFSAPMVRFVGVGAATVAIDAAAYQALLASGTESAAAKAASFVTGAFFAYFANWRFTFGERRHARWAPVAFAAVYGCALALNTGVNEAVLGVLGDDDRLSVTAAFLVATAVSATWNFLGMSRFVFSSPPTRAEPEWPTIDPTTRVTPPE